MMNGTAGCAKLALLIAGALATSGCGGDASNQAEARRPGILSAAGLDSTQEATPAGRLQIKRGKDYVPINVDPQTLFTSLEGSMAERRRTAWTIVEAMLEPQPITVAGKTHPVPLWLTWFEGGTRPGGNNEVDGKIRLFFEALKDCGMPCARPYDEIAREVVADTSGAQRAEKNLARTLTSENFTQILRQDEGEERTLGGLVGRGFTLFSPSFVEHVLAQAKGIETCLQPPNAKRASDPPRSASQFSHCIDEFPRSAVMVKASWIELPRGGGDFDTSAQGMRRLLGSEPAWPQPTRLPLNERNIYAVQAADNKVYGLQGIHFSTKDTREWVWISLWWSPRPNEDFGADRPASLNRFNDGVWANYKMCVTTAFDEGDPAPWQSFEARQPSLAAAIRAVHETLGSQTGPAPYDKVTSWCSNPTVETHPNNHKTSCIGCHQYSLVLNENPGLEGRPLTGTTRFYDPLMLRQNASGAFLPIGAQNRSAYERSYPQLGRSRLRSNFPADFAWSTVLEFRPQITTARQENGIEW